MEFGSVTLKRSWFLCFPIKHSTHIRPGLGFVGLGVLRGVGPPRAPHVSGGLGRHTLLAKECGVRKGNNVFLSPFLDDQVVKHGT
jgi:hypothetical protein